MSRIGNKEIKIPAGVTVKTDAGFVEVAGKLGTLRRPIERGIGVTVNGDIINVTRVNDSKAAKERHGLSRTLIDNMVKGVSEGYKKALIINGVGYKATKQAGKIVLNIGFSHPVEVKEENGITFELPTATEIVVLGNDKEKVGQVAANIRQLKPVEPYHHYGIRYSTEKPKKKEGKTGAKK